jgi:membrane associated rhomboid family serine protease
MAAAANIWEDLKMRYYQGNTVIRLIMANVAVHVAILLVSVVFYLLTASNDSYFLFIREWFYFPSDITKIPFRFWSIFTYMFLHDLGGILHILMNMLMLFWFGNQLSNLISNDKIFPIYIWGGVVGALFFVIGYNIFPPFWGSSGNLVGASASVMAIVLATATLNPKGRMRLLIIGEIELQYIALAWIIYNIIVTLYSNPGGALAHLGGAFMGWCFIYQLRRGVDLSKPINKVIDWVMRRKRSPSKAKTKTKKTPHQRTESPYKAKMKVYKGSQKSDYYGNEYGRSFMQKYKEMSREECLDMILDKIKRSGYDSLSEDEKVFLDRYQ